MDNNEPLISRFPDFEPFNETEDSEKLKVFDINWLPDGIFRKYAKDACNSIIVSPDMIAPALLTMVSACVHHKFYVEVNPSFIKPLNIYMNIVSAPGTRKSPAEKCVSFPLIDYEIEKNKGLGDAQKKQQWKKKDAEKELKRIEKNLDKGTGDITGLKTRAEEQKAIISDIELHPIKRYQLIAGDITAESVVNIMRDNHESINIISSEGGLFDTMAGRYSNDGKTGNFDVYLKAWSEDHTPVDRKSDDLHIFLEKPSMSILMFVQPSVMLEIRENRQFSGRGLLSRFCYVFPHKRKGTLSEEVPISSEVKKEYENTLFDLLKIPDDKPPVHLKFEKDALPLEDKLYSKAEERQEECTGDTIKEWYSKKFGLTVIISGILHIMTYGSRSGEYAISKELLEDADAIADYFSNHAEYALSSGGVVRNKAEEAGLYIIQKISRMKDIPTFKAKDGFQYQYLRVQEAYQACKKKYDTRKKFQIGLDELVRRGYVRMMKDDSRHSGSPTEYMIFNPDIKLGNIRNEMFNIENMADIFEEEKREIALNRLKE